MLSKIIVPTAMLTGYLECALWSSLDDNDRPFDDRDGAIDRITKASRRAAKADLRAFLEAVREKLGDPATVLASVSDGRAGHNVWLNRNRHGAGFQDDGLNEVADIARGMGSIDPRRLRNGWIVIE